MRPIDAHDTNMRLLELYNCETSECVKCRLRSVMAIIRDAPTVTPSAKLDRAQWVGCSCCTAGDGEFRLDKWGDEDYCPKCGRPLTEEAWEKMEQRIGGNDGTID